MTAFSRAWRYRAATAQAVLARAFLKRARRRKERRLGKIACSGRDVVGFVRLDNRDVM